MSIHFLRYWFYLTGVQTLLLNWGSNADAQLIWPSCLFYQNKKRHTAHMHAKTCHTVTHWMDQRTVQQNAKYTWHVSHTMHSLAEMVYLISLQMNQHHSPLIFNNLVIMTNSLTLSAACTMTGHSSFGIILATNVGLKSTSLTSILVAWKQKRTDLNLKQLYQFRKRHNTSSVRISAIYFELLLRCLSAAFAKIFLMYFQRIHDMSSQDKRSHP